MREHKKILGKVAMTPEGIWDINKKYPILGIVTHEDTKHAYIAKKDVPKGIPIEHNEYWQPINVSGYAESNIINLSQRENSAQLKSFTLQEAISSIAEVGRKSGTVLMFYNLNEDRQDISAGWEIWQFNDTNLYNWENTKYWINIYANYTKFVGWYVNEITLKRYNPYPSVGQYAYVGTDFNEAYVYRCEAKNIWTNSENKAIDYVQITISNVVQTRGKSETAVMSQYAVTRELGLLEELISKVETESIGNISNTIAEIQQSIKILQGADKLIVATITTLDKKVTTANKNIENLQKQIDNLGGSIDSGLSNRVSVVENQIVVINSELESIKTSIGTVNNEAITKLSQRVSSIETAIDDINEALSKVGEASNIYNSSIEDKSTTVPVTIGDITAGTTLDSLHNKKSFNDLFDSILFPTIYPTIEEPSLKLTLKNYSTLVEVGATGVTADNLIYNFDRGYIKLNGVAKGNTVGTQTSVVKYYNSNEANTAFPTIMREGNTTYHCKVYYGEGDQPKDSKGNNYGSPRPAGSIESNMIVVNATYPWFASTDNSGVIKQSLVKWNSTSGSMNTGEFKLKATAVTPQVFKLPRAAVNVYKYNEISGKFEIEDKKYYIKTQENITINDVIKTYDVYTFNVAEYGHRGEVTLKITF